MSTERELSNKERYRIGNKVTIITIIINIILAVVKVSAGILFNSTAILADGIHTISDVGSSIGIIISFFISSKPEDMKHQYGHEKAESIAGFVLAIFLTGVGLIIGYTSIIRIVQKQAGFPGILTAWIAGLSILIKEFQFRLSMYGGKKINSNALIADAWHHRSDAFSSIAALIGIVGSRMGYAFLDPIAGLLVSIIVIRVGLQLFISGFNELMDTSIARDKLEHLQNQILTNIKVKHVSQIRSRQHGPKVFIDMHLCVDPNITIRDGHTIVHEIKDIVMENVLNTKDVIISVNPCGLEDHNNCSTCVHNNDFT